MMFRRFIVSLAVVPPVAVWVWIIAEFVGLAFEYPFGGWFDVAAFAFCLVTFTVVILGGALSLGIQISQDMRRDEIGSW